MSRQSLVLSGCVAIAVASVSLFAMVFMASISTEVSAQGTSKATVVDIKTKLLFDVAVMRNKKKPFVVFYYSSSECVPCKWSLLPMLEKMVKRKGEFVNLASVDFDKVPAFKEEHGISEIPTVMVFYKGDVMDIVEGKNWSPIVALVNRATKLVQ